VTPAGHALPPGVAPADIQSLELFIMNRVHLTPPETIVPLKTATRLLRIAVTLRIAPVVLAGIILLISLGTQVLDTILLVTWPSLALWVFVMARPGAPAGTVLFAAEPGVDHCGPNPNRP
jgi:hypothetical protein